MAQTEKRDPRLPMVNLNGDAASTLQHNFREAYEAVGIALVRLREAAPHGRNYQYEGSDFTGARNEHWERLAQLDAMQQRMLELFEAVS